MNSPFARQVIQHILRTEWDLLLDAGRAWNQAEKDDVIPQLIIITALLLKGDYREAYEHHEALFSKFEDGESQDDPLPRTLATKTGSSGANLRRGDASRLGGIFPKRW